MSDKAEIIAALERYMMEVLEPKQQEFGNLPVCPFVRAERVTKKIRYEICEMLPGLPRGDVEFLVRQFAGDDYHSTMLIVDPVKHLTKDEAFRYGIILCEMVCDTEMVAIALHPDDEFEVAGFRPRCRIPYTTILVQAASLISDAKSKLAETSYYANWSQADLDFNYKQFGRFLK